MQQSAHDGLVAGLKKCGDDPNRAFLMTQLSKLARPGDAELFASYLSDPYLRHYAVNGLSLVPGDDAQSQVGRVLADRMDRAALGPTPETEMSCWNSRSSSAVAKP